MKNYIFLILLIFTIYSNAEIYYTSPTGTAKDLSKVTRDNPAEWRWITQFEGSEQLKCGDIVYLRHDQGIYTEGTRVLATGCSDTFDGAIHFMSEPGGFAVFRIKKYPQNNPRHLERFVNPSGIVIGGEWYWKGSGRNPVTDYNIRPAHQSALGRYVWIREIIVQGNYGTEKPVRDFSTITDMPYGSTGKGDPDTIAGSQRYDNMTGGITINAYGCRVINCLFWNLGKSGLGVASNLDTLNATFYGNVVTNTGHSSPERDRFHSVYQQWGSFNKGRLIHKHSIFQFSAEEQLQLWAQGGVDEATGESKVDNIDLIENVLINGGTLSGKKHPNRTAPNSKIAGYTYDTDIRIIGNISWHDRGAYSWQSGYSLNGNNDRRNLYVKNNYLVGNAASFRNVSSIKEVSGNTFVALNGKQLDFQVKTILEKDMLAHATKWNNNSFYGGGNVHYSRWVRDNVRDSYDKISFSNWQKKGFDKYSIYYKGLPDDQIFYFRNEYLDYYPTNWQGHFVVMNWSGNDEVQINVDEYGLNRGDIFRVIDVQNIAGDCVSNYLYEGKYTQGMSVVVPVNQTEVVPDPTGEMLGPYHTDKRFFTGLVIRVSQDSPRPIDPNPVDPNPQNPAPKIIGGQLIREDGLEHFRVTTDPPVVGSVTITPIGGLPHLENGEPYTAYTRKGYIENTGVEAKGIVTYHVTAFSEPQGKGEASEVQIFNIDYGGDDPDPVDPDPTPDDYVTTQYLDESFKALEENNQARYNLIDQQIKILIDLINAMDLRLKALDEKKLILKEE